MAVSHKDHNHPNTPAARAACRKALADGNQVATTDGKWVEAPVKNTKDQGITKPAQIAVVPRKRGDGGVVKGLQATAPHANTARRLKVSGTKIKSIGDLADVPRVLAPWVREAWRREWTVQAGYPFNESERRVVISGPSAEIAIVWDDRDRVGGFVRAWDSSITKRCDDMTAAFRLAE